MSVIKIKITPGKEIRDDLTKGFVCEVYIDDLRCFGHVFDGKVHETIKEASEWLESSYADTSFERSWIDDTTMQIII